MKYEDRLPDQLPVRIPMSGTFELTVRCNLHCKMCLFRHDDSENRTLMENELTAAQWIDLAGQAAKMGTLNLLITDSGDAFRKTLEGIRRLMELPSAMEFRTTVIRDNYADLDAMIDLVHREFGEQYRLIQTRLVTQSVRGACADVSACRLEPEDNVRLAFHSGLKIMKEFIDDLFDEKNVYAEYREAGRDSVWKPRATLFGCDAGMSSYTVSWDGQLLGCQMMGNFAEDILRKGMSEMPAGTGGCGCAGGGAL